MNTTHQYCQIANLLSQSGDSYGDCDGYCNGDSDDQNNKDDEKATNTTTTTSMTATTKNPA